MFGTKDFNVGNSFIIAIDDVPQNLWSRMWFLSSSNICGLNEIGYKEETEVSFILLWLESKTIGIDFFYFYEKLINTYYNMKPKKNN